MAVKKLFRGHPFNPLVYLVVILTFFMSFWDGGIKEWIKETKRLFKKLNPTNHAKRN